MLMWSIFLPALSLLFKNVNLLTDYITTIHIFHHENISDNKFRRFIDI